MADSPEEDTSLVMGTPDLSMAPEFPPEDGVLPGDKPLREEGERGRHHDEEDGGDHSDHDHGDDLMDHSDRAAGPEAQSGAAPERSTLCMEPFHLLYVACMGTPNAPGCESVQELCTEGSLDPDCSAAKEMLEAKPALGMSARDAFVQVRAICDDHEMDACSECPAPADLDDPSTFAAACPEGPFEVLAELCGVHDMTFCTEFKTLCEGDAAFPQCTGAMAPIVAEEQEVGAAPAPDAAAALWTGRLIAVVVCVSAAIMFI